MLLNIATIKQLIMDYFPNIKKFIRTLCNAVVDLGGFFGG